MACSSSSGGSGGTPGTDGGDDGAGGQDGTTMGDVACTPLSATLKGSTLDGGTLWSCFEAMCGPSLMTCDTDCVCNNALLTALMNIQTMGMSSATSQFGTFAGADSNAMAVVTCVSGKLNMCMGTPADGGDAGNHPDTGTETGTGSEPGTEAGSDALVDVAVDVALDVVSQ